MNTIAKIYANGDTRVFGCAQPLRVAVEHEWNRAFHYLASTDVHSVFVLRRFLYGDAVPLGATFVNAIIRDDFSDEYWFLCQE